MSASSQVLAQSNPPVIQAWQVVALLGSNALLGAYGIPMTRLDPVRILTTSC